MRLRTSVGVEVGPLWVADDILGQHIDFMRAGFRVTIEFPPAPASDSAGTPTFDGSRQSLPGTVTKRGLRRLLITLRWDQPTQADSESSGLSVDTAREIRRAREVAFVVARDFVDWIRVLRRQAWLPEHLQDLARVVAGGAVNEETGEALPLVVGTDMIAIDRPSGTEVDVAFAAELAVLLEKEERIPLPERFLADAEYFARRMRAAEVQRAVVLAAIATELKVKEVLRERASGGPSAPFVEIIVDNPRDVSVAVGGLFHKTMKATTGKSLQEEAPDLFSSVERLFTIRNRIVHSGNVPDPKEGKSVVDAAREAFRWLDLV